MIDVLMDIISSFLLYDPRLYFCLHYKLHDSIWINPVGIGMHVPLYKLCHQTISCFPDATERKNFKKRKKKIQQWKPSSVMFL